MRYKNLILGLLSVVYSIILVHNLTPHRHGKQHLELPLGSTLSEWFDFLFGHEHQDEVQDEEHLTTFRLQDDNVLEYPDFSFSDAHFYAILPNFFHPISLVEPAFIARTTGSSYLSFCSNADDNYIIFPSIGRAPPM